MTKRTVFESDFSGQGGAQPTLLGYEGAWFEVDLTDDERGELNRLLAPYISVGRRTLDPGTARRRAVPDTTNEERETVRAWAREHGYEIASYGRIPKKVFAAYQEANGPLTTHHAA